MKRGNILVGAGGICLGLLLTGMTWLPFLAIVQEDLCDPPIEVGHRVVKTDDGQGNYTSSMYIEACENEFDLWELLFYKVFPEKREKWDKNKIQEFADLVNKSHQREIRMALDNSELNVWLEKKVVDERNKAETYFYGTDNDYTVEIDGQMGHIRSLRTNGNIVNYTSE